MNKGQEVLHKPTWSKQGGNHPIMEAKAVKEDLMKT